MVRVTPRPSTVEELFRDPDAKAGEGEEAKEDTATNKAKKTKKAES